MSPANPYQVYIYFLKSSYFDSTFRAIISNNLYANGTFVQPTAPGSAEPGSEPAEAIDRLLRILLITKQQSITRYKLTALQCTARSVSHARTHEHKEAQRPPTWLCALEYCITGFIPGPRLSAGSSSNVQYRAERIKIPSTPRYLRSMLGSDRGNVKTETERNSSNEQIYTDSLVLVFFFCFHTVELLEVESAIKSYKSLESNLFFVF